MEKFFKSYSAHKIQLFPISIDFILIKEVDTTNGVLYLEGNNVIHDILGKGDDGDKISKCYTLTNLRSLSI